jgi:hypothetical protein
MRTITKLVPFAFLGAASWLQACGSVKYDDGANQFPPKGVIRGSITYSGPAPCSQSGHIIGNALILVFDRRNPPAPAGLSNFPANFTAVPGDILFRDWPRTPDDVKRCPDPSQLLTVSAPFTVAPMDAGSYLIQAFYDYTGDFLPTFKVRQLPEATDVGGGFIDIGDATSLEPDFSQRLGTDANGNPIYAQIPKQSDPNYLPKFLPIDIGTAGPIPVGSLRGVPTFTMPPDGYLRDNIAVTIGARLPLARPYFFPEGIVLPTKDSKGNAMTDQTAGGVKTYGASNVLPNPVVPTPSNPDLSAAYQPVLTISASYAGYAAPNPTTALLTPDIVNQYQANFPQLRLNFGVPDPELTSATAVDQSDPFHMQLKPAQAGNGGVFVWWDGNHSDQRLNFIPESPPGQIRKMWPLIVLAKLQEPADPNAPPHTFDPQSLITQGTDGKHGAVIIQGITIAGDSLLQFAQGNSCIDENNTGACSKPIVTPGAGVKLTDISTTTRPTADNLQDHVTVLLRPSAICFDPQHIDQGGTIVIPHPNSKYPPSDTTDPVDKNGEAPVTDFTSVLANPQVSSLVHTYAPACIPPGRYQINMVYPTGQAWTTPNEAGHCATGEGPTNLNLNGSPGDCGLKSRPVLTSQGTRAFVEVIDDPVYCHDGTHDVPDICK